MTEVFHTIESAAAADLREESELTIILPYGRYNLSSFKLNLTFRGNRPATALKRYINSISFCDATGREITSSTGYRYVSSLEYRSSKSFSMQTDKNGYTTVRDRIALDLFNDPKTIEGKFIMKFGVDRNFAPEILSFYLSQDPMEQHGSIVREFMLSSYSTYEILSNENVSLSRIADRIYLLSNDGSHTHADLNYVELQDRPKIENTRLLYNLYKEVFSEQSYSEWYNYSGPLVFNLDSEEMRPSRFLISTVSDRKFIMVERMKKKIVFDQDGLVVRTVD